MISPPSVGEMLQQLAQAGASEKLQRRALRLWMQGKAQNSGRRAIEDFIPKTLRAALPALEAQWASWISEPSVHEDAGDGARRLLARLHDGQLVETVLLPRDGVCVSTQVGCAVGCTFCMTGTTGLIRQLGSAEIIAQVVMARRHQKVRKVVFMGMGEPAHNLDAVLEAIDWLGQEGNIGHKNLVLSTVGDERLFERLQGQRVKPALAVSLHTTRPDLRRQLLPRAPDMDIETLVQRAEDWARYSAYPVQYQWTLLEGVNDSDQELEGIVQLLQGKYALMNFIPYNEVPGMPWKRPSWERAAEMARWLHRRGVLCKLRHSAGQEVQGGCGQLRARAVLEEGQFPVQWQGRNKVKATEPTLLLTGFEPFGGDARNPSADLALSLHGQRVAGYRIHAVELPCAFEAASAALKVVLAQHKPQAVLSLGLAAGRRALSLERVAINWQDARIPDNAGHQPIDQAVIEGGPAAYFGTWPIKSMVAAVRDAGGVAEVSHTAGTYVCNHVFYTLMHLATSLPELRRAGFMHIPLSTEMLAEKPFVGDPPPAVALADMRSNLMRMLEAGLTRESDLRFSEGTVA